MYSSHLGMEIFLQNIMDRQIFVDTIFVGLILDGFNFLWGEKTCEKKLTKNKGLKIKPAENCNNYVRRRYQVSAQQMTKKAHWRYAVRDVHAIVIVTGFLQPLSSRFLRPESNNHLELRKFIV